jgi:hypothetical protein
MSKNPIIGISLAVVLASVATSLVLIEQKALATVVQPPVDQCTDLKKTFDEDKAKLIDDIKGNNLSDLRADLSAFIRAAGALTRAQCSLT